jgi:uncharacterized DUF497 family protein
MSDRARFEWDSEKDAENRRKHRVSFDEASSVWNDSHKIEEVDVVHSTEQELRYRVLGISEKLRLLLVIFTERHETIRVISARPATKAESRRYAEQV